jgi:hypothetical protein
MKSFVFACATAENTLETRPSSRPERSIGRIVFSNVGDAVRATIASISARSCLIPSSSAGW